MQGEDSDIQYVIALVPGTFGGNARWIGTGSRLRCAIEQALGGSKAVRFEEFTWGGLWGTRFNNGHRYRLTAGRNLAERLITMTRSFPSAKHFIIAHSHGGNVTMYALRSEELQKQITGVICLGTPFITCEARNLAAFGIYPFTMSYLPLFAIIMIVVLVALVPVFLFYSLFLKLPNYARYFIGFLGIWLYGVIVLRGIELHGKLMTRILEQLDFWIQKEQRRIVDRIRPPFIYGPSIFCAHTPGDEATRHLRALRTFASIPFWLWDFWFYVAVFVLLLAGGLIWPHWIPAWVSRDEGVLGGASVMALGSVILLSIAHLGILGILPLLVRAHGIGFGQEGILENLLVSIGLKDTPQYGEFVQRSYVLRGFPRHAAFYQDPRVLRDICDYIRLGRLAERSRHEFEIT